MESPKHEGATPEKRARRVLLSVDEFPYGLDIFESSPEMMQTGERGGHLTGGYIHEDVIAGKGFALSNDPDYGPKQGRTDWISPAIERVVIHKNRCFIRVAMDSRYFEVTARKKSPEIKPRVTAVSRVFKKIRTTLVAILAGTVVGIPLVQFVREQVEIYGINNDSEDATRNIQRLVDEHTRMTQEYVRTADERIALNVDSAAELTDQRLAQIYRMDGKLQEIQKAIDRKNAEIDEINREVTARIKDFNARNWFVDLPYSEPVQHAQ